MWSINPILKWCSLRSTTSAEGRREYLSPHITASAQRPARETGSHCFDSTRNSPIFQIHRYRTRDSSRCPEEKTQDIDCSIEHQALLSATICPATAAASSSSILASVQVRARKQAGDMRKRSDQSTAKTPCKGVGRPHTGKCRIPPYGSRPP
jgi:hypothetical protein